MIDQKPFSLEERMKLDVKFCDKKMKTTIYVKINAHDQLPLSEGVCHQLGIVQYHPDVCVWQASKQTELPVPQVKLSDIKVARKVRVLPQQCSVVSVKLIGVHNSQDSLLLEPVNLDGGLQVEPTLIQLTATGTYDLPVDNCMGFIHLLVRQRSHSGKSC